MTESSAQRLTRLLSLVPWLMRHEGVTIQEAAEHFAVTSEQLQKDLWLVVCCGLPGHGPDQLIDIQFWDDEGHIDVIDPQALVAPTRLTVDEAASLLIGLSLLRDIADESDLIHIDTTMELITDATRDLQAGPLAIHTNPQAHHDVLAAISAATREGQALEIDYYSASRDVSSLRVVWPDRIVLSDGRALLEAWCTHAQAARTFRIDRISSASILATNERPSIDPGTQPERGPTRVEVALHPSARWLLDVYDLTVAEPSGGAPLPAGWITATWEVWDRHWLVRLVLSLGGDLLVVHPRPWADEVLQAAHRGISSLNRA